MRGSLRGDPSGLISYKAEQMSRKAKMRSGVSGVSTPLPYNELMLVLGIETSCDETAVGIVADGRRLLTNVVASQAAIHARYGGVVPEVASRHHIEAMLPVIRAALTEAGCKPSDLDAIAV